VDIYEELHRFGRAGLDPSEDVYRDLGVQLLNLLVIQNLNAKKLLTLACDPL
jgi:hypothetical protein